MALSAALPQTIAAIAQMLCFADASSFSRAFRRAFGYRPSDVRDAAMAGVVPALMPQARASQDNADFSDLLRCF